MKTLNIKLEDLISITIYSTKNKEYKTILYNCPDELIYLLSFTNESKDEHVCRYCGTPITEENKNDHLDCEQEYYSYEKVKQYVESLFYDSEIDDKIIIEFAYISNCKMVNKIITKKF